MASEGTGFKDLPVELVREVANHLDTQSMARLAQTSLGINGALSDDLAKKKEKFISEALAPQEWYDKAFDKDADGKVFLKPSADSLDLPPQKMVRASITGDFATLRSYLEGGVDPNSYCLMGRRLVSIALRNGHYEAAKLLVKYGADVNLHDIHLRDTESNSLFYAYALRSRIKTGTEFDKIDERIFSQILQLGAKIDSWVMFCKLLEFPNFASIFKETMRNGTDLYSLKGCFGETVLHESVRKFAVAKLVLEEAPGLLNMKDNSGKNALIYAIECSRELNNVPERPELHVAILQGNATIVKALLNLPHIDLNFSCGLFNTPLHRAFKNKNFEIMEILVADRRTKVSDDLVNDMLSWHRISKARGLQTQMEGTSRVLQKLGIDH